MEWVRDARRRTLDLVADLDAERLEGPRLSGRSPLRWLIGHVAWFQERWVLRHGAGMPPLNGASDAVYDAALTCPDDRWTLPFYSRDNAFHYLEEVRDAVVDRLRYSRTTPHDRYLATLSVLHEDRHAEAIMAFRQECGYSAPRLREAGWPALIPEGGALSGDARIPGGAFLLGAAPDDACAWEDEKWAHPVTVAPFALARAPVTQSEFALFLADGGYRRPELWSDEGWRWRECAGREHPGSWRSVPGVGWQRRVFDRWVAVEPHRPVTHVSWFEAEAYCRWAGRRLPTEGEWEFAASWDPATRRKRRFPWGDTPLTPRRACVDGVGRGTLDVGALPEGDSPWGCRQMLGNVWEWTASEYAPYPGFEGNGCGRPATDRFHGRKTLRGGSWATRARLARNTLRLGLTPDRDDYWCGFRTCPLDG